MKRRKRGFTNKAFALIVAVALVLGCAIGGTIAWLTDETDAVVNTFTYGDIAIELTENTGSDYQILPGNDITKDPTITVEAGSEDCWLFVKVEKSYWPDFTESDNSTLKVSYEMAEGWLQLTDAGGNPVEGVYYRQVDAVSSDADVTFSVLEDNKIIVSSNLTKAEVDTVKDTPPELTFTAYAVQRDDYITTAFQAWGIAAE